MEPVRSPDGQVGQYQGLKSICPDLDHWLHNALGFVGEVARWAVKRGRGFEAVWGELSLWLENELLTKVESAKENLERLFEQTEKEVAYWDREINLLQGELTHANQVLREGWSPFNKWLTFVLFWLVLMGETLSFPFIYRDVFDMPLIVGFGFAALFPGASIFIKGTVYSNLSERSRQRF